MPPADWRGHNQRAAVGPIVYIADEGNHVSQSRQLSAHRFKRRSATRIDNQIPSLLSGEPYGRAKPKPRDAPVISAVRVDVMVYPFIRHVLQL